MESSPFQRRQRQFIKRHRVGVIGTMQSVRVRTRVLLADGGIEFRLPNPIDIAAAGNGRS